MRFKNLITIAASFAVFGNVYAKSTLTSTGDALMIAVPTSAFLISTIKNDKPGQIEFIKSMGVNIALTHALKFSLKKTSLDKRPNGRHYSFPSGHSSAVFGGAFFLYHRYGFKYAAPALALAGLTGYSRVRAKAHHWRDVIGGAALAYGASYFLVTKFKDREVAVNTHIGKGEFLVGVNIK